MSSRPETSVGNCCPGLEFDFRAVWRRIFEGITLREYDSLVMEDLTTDETDPQSLEAPLADGDRDAARAREDAEEGCRGRGRIAEG